MPGTSSTGFWRSARPAKRSGAASAVLPAAVRTSGRRDVRIARYVTVGPGGLRVPAGSACAWRNGTPTAHGCSRPGVNNWCPTGHRPSSIRTHRSECPLPRTAQSAQGRSRGHLHFCHSVTLNAEPPPRQRRDSDLHWLQHRELFTLRTVGTLQFGSWLADQSVHAAVGALLTVNGKECCMGCAPLFVFPGSTVGIDT